VVQLSIFARAPRRRGPLPGSAERGEHAHHPEPHAGDWPGALNSELRLCRNLPRTDRDDDPTCELFGCRGALPA
jgi:hypothetical protein